MLLLNSLIVLLFLLIIAHFIKIVWGKKEKDGLEGFANLEVDEINSDYDVTIANDLEKGEPSTKQLAVFGGEMAPPIGKGHLTPSQKVQAQAKTTQKQEEEQIVGQHKEAADNALNMQYLKDQMDKLVKLSNE